MADKTVRGRFVWHELMTPDAAASHGFYSKVLGWKTQPFDQDPSYTMFAASTGPLGGTVTLAGGAPQWLPYVGTTDIEATLRQATELGATVTKEIGAAGTGRYAVLTDPQGATFAVYSSDTPPSKEKPAKRGEFSWHELATTDVQAAFKFYAALFGWEKLQEYDMGAMGPYLIFGRNGRQLGGIFNKPASMQGPSAWLGYVRVKDVNQIAKKAQKSGGRLINGPMEVPGGDWIAQFLDPHGAMFAVHALKEDVQSAAPAEAGASAAPPAQTAADAMAETTVLTEVPEPEAKVRSASKKSKRVAKPAAKKAVTRKAAKKPAKKKAAKKAKTAAKKKGAAAKSAKKSAKKVSKAAKKKAGKKKAVKKKAAKKQRRPAGKKKSTKKARKGK